MIIAVNFADKKFRRNQKWNSVSAKLLGKIDKVIEYSPEDIEKEYFETNKESVKYSEKGLGNYFWKPVIVNKAFQTLSEGDYLFYADSGSVFIKSVLPLIDHMKEQQKNIMCFRLPLIEKQWTKKDAFLLMDCDHPKYANTCQILATFFIVRKCKESEEFLKDYEKFASDSRILCDDANTLGKPNFEEFIEHRHDQSVLSLLSKKHGNVLIEDDLSDYGCFPYRYILNPQHLFDKNIVENPQNNIFRGTVLSNRSGHPLYYYIKYLIRSVVYKFGIKI